MRFIFVLKLTEPFFLAIFYHSLEHLRLHESCRQNFPAYKFLHLKVIIEFLDTKTTDLRMPARNFHMFIIKKFLKIKLVASYIIMDNMTVESAPILKEKILS